MAWITVYLFFNKRIISIAFMRNIFALLFMLSLTPCAGAQFRALEKGTAEAYRQEIRSKQMLAEAQAEMSERQWHEQQEAKLIADAVDSGLETDATLTEIKAAPREYLSAPVVMTGLALIDIYYNYGYRNAERSHYSLSFKQDNSGEDEVSIYLARNTGQAIAERIIRETASGKPTHIRIKAMLSSWRYSDGGWDSLELIDVQFATTDGWGPWVIQTERKSAAKAAVQIAKEIEQRDASVVNRAKEAKSSERLARTRTWTDSTGQSSIVAEYAGVIGGDVLLRSTTGKVVRVPIDRLSSKDRTWLGARRKSKR